MSGHHKGPSFEREICKQLSKWWTQDDKEPRDDVFWRSSQSGGRATQRAKSGQKTYGAYGDIAAVDPIGEPFLRAFTIELKCGKSHGYPMEMLEGFSKNECQKQFELTILQARSAHLASGSMGWMIISRRDYKHTMVYMDLPTARNFPSLLTISPRVIFRLWINPPDKTIGLKLSVLGMRLSDFLKWTLPYQIISGCRE